MRTLKRKYYAYHLMKIIHVDGSFQQLQSAAYTICSLAWESRDDNDNVVELFLSLLSFQGFISMVILLKMP